MSRTYHGRSKRAKGNFGRNFEVNFSGADALGVIMKQVGRHNTVLEDADKNMPFKRPPCTWFSRTAKDARADAVALRNMDIPQTHAAYAGCRGLVDMTDREFAAFVEEWTQFLDTCGGYRVI